MATTIPSSPRSPNSASAACMNADDSLIPRLLSRSENPMLPNSSDEYSSDSRILPGTESMYQSKKSDSESTDSSSPEPEQASPSHPLLHRSTSHDSAHMYSRTGESVSSSEAPMHPQMLKVAPEKSSRPVPGAEPEIKLDAVFAKSKRSPSTSNDVSYERDRFRARYVTFNPSPVPASKDSPKNGTTLRNDCDYCEKISTKTKKLNFRSPMRTCSPECVAAVLSEYSLTEKVSPLDQESNLFESYKLCSSSESSKLLKIHQISVAQLQTAFHWYFNKPLPSTNSMFPWLHGLHKENFAQRSFFAAQGRLQDNGNAAMITNEELTVPKPKYARFVMCVECAPPKSTMTRIIRNTVSVDQILQKIQYSRSEVISQLTRIMTNLFSVEHHSAEEIESVTNDIIGDCLETGFMPVFLDSDPRKGISLRNFHIQVNKAATCSDFVVYDSGSENSARCQSIARLLKVAQMLEQVSAHSKYNVFMLESDKLDLTDNAPLDITTIRETPNYSGHDNTKKTQLLLYSMMLSKADTFSSWDADYQVKEKVETTRMTAATKLHLNVWSGNIWDHQVMMHYFKTFDDEGTHNVDIVPLKDTRDLYCDPKNSSLTRDISSWGPTLFSVLPPPRSHWQLFVYCHNEASFPNQSVLSDLLFKYSITSRKASEVEEVHQLEFPSSGSIGFGDCRQDNLMSIVNTCKLLYLYSSSTTENSLASLIYCSDGYTESSLLIFCYLMYAKNIPLEEAMISLHNEYGRPFYVFNTDVQVLRKLEVLLRKFSPSNDTIWSQLETISNHEINEILLGSSKKPQSQAIPKKLRLGYIECSDSDSDSESDSEFGIPAIDHNRLWVEEVEGSLPSKILPYLYLGSLKHANNLTLMSKLGIEKIVSVGENLDWINGYKFQAQHRIKKTSLDGGDVEIFDISARDSHKTHYSVNSVMKVNNLQDDGIDDLTKSLSRILEYINEAHRQSDGKTKILVHCRVGVSRSVTVVIAEVMRRLSLNLPKAYLYVRVRRLNIVIQPNLRFMYELFKWEEQERLRSKASSAEDLRVIDWFVMCQEIKKLNQPFVCN